MSSFLKLVFALSRGAESKPNPKEKGGLVRTANRACRRDQLAQDHRDSSALALARPVRDRRLEKARWPFAHENLAPPDCAHGKEKLGEVLTALIVAEQMKMLRDGAPMGWQVHQRACGYKETWSTSTLESWRLSSRRSLYCSRPRPGTTVHEMQTHAGKLKTEPFIPA